jgi:reverse gyrase
MTNSKQYLAEPVVFRAEMEHKELKENLRPAKKFSESGVTLTRNRRMSRPPLPPYTAETAVQKVRLAGTSAFREAQVIDLRR